MNINFVDLEKLIKIAENSNINSLEVTDGDTRISIVCESNGNQNSNSINHHDIEKNSENPLANIMSNSEQRAPTSEQSRNEEKDPVEDAKDQISAPMLGTFYRRSEPTADAFVEVGDQVEQGQTLCIIEAMKMMHEVKAESECTIKDILVNEGDIVEYGQSLFIVEPNS